MFQSPVKWKWRGVVELRSELKRIEDQPWVALGHLHLATQMMGLSNWSSNLRRDAGGTKRGEAPMAMRIHLIENWGKCKTIGVSPVAATTVLREIRISKQLLKKEKKNISSLLFLVSRRCLELVDLRHSLMGFYCIIPVVSLFLGLFLFCPLKCRSWNSCVLGQIHRYTNEDLSHFAGQ